MFTKILFYFGYFFSLLGVLSGMLTYSRWKLPYNELGRYYDPKDSIVYHQQEFESFAAITGISLLLGSVFLIAALIRSR